MYKILYCRFSGGQRLVVVFDFKGEQTIEFSLDELEKEELPEELKQYIKGIREGIDSGYYDYSL
ncbi:hypothetical protein P9E34_14070 [Schinkia azotoformans]|uniref:hypothetical protein n=1 Tax=Schinkia azotoformans TaxID=1454 RepID=UPI002DBC07D0|nr:hypothetical protein [Schinkia azotoformans]MEC1725842.1 hypothetical protein [Schinkia azotoformans]